MTAPQFVIRTQLRDPHAPRATGTTPLTPLDIVPLTPDLANWWDTHVQRPFISHASIPTNKRRADFTWPSLNTLRGAVKIIANFNGRPYEEWAILWTPPTTHTPVVCGWILLEHHYDHLPDHARQKRARRKSPYVWYLSRIPEEYFLITYGLQPYPARLGQICIDIALARSLGTNQSGRLGLHADANAPRTSAHKLGNTLLTDWYQTQGMTRLPKSARLRRWRELAPNDGGYFYFSDKSGQLCYRQLRNYRLDR